MMIRLARLGALALVLSILVPLPDSAAQVFATDYTYTTDADFDLGTLVSVNHDAPFSDQLQLDSPTEPFPFINVAASGRGTVVRVNTGTGEIVGEYRTAPEERGLNPSRTTVDLFGNVWTANRGEVDEIGGVPHGSAVKVGLIVGGTRVDDTGSPDPAGGYLAPPFGYNTCIDRDMDGLIRTSGGLGDILGWPDNSDGVGGADGLVEDAEDECILIFQRLFDAEQARHVSVDADNNVWVGGYPFDLRMFYKLDGTTGAILDSFNARDFGCGGYGGLVDGNGVLWSIGWGWGEGILLRYDPATDTGQCVDTKGGYGLGIDTNGYVWASIWNNGISKVSPDGTLQPGFPKSTWPMTGMSMSSSSHAMQAAPASLTFNSMLQVTDTSFWVAPHDEWVASQDPWTPNATIDLTIEDGSGVVYTDSQMSDGDGNFHFGFWDMFDLQAGHEVTVTDGTFTKAHTVTNLLVDGVDLTADTVFGRADAGTTVEVWVHDDGSVTATTDGSGNWTADFSGMTDLTGLSDGGSAQYDSDGDATGVWWASPRFMAAPQGDRVEASGTWTPGATVSLTVEDGSGVIYFDSQTSSDTGYFSFEFGEVFDLQRGHIVTVSDGTNTKTHTVTNLYVDGVDVGQDTVFGRADAGTAVHVWAHEGGSLDVVADSSGNWATAFFGIVDLTYASDGGSQQMDDDGDTTGVWWGSPRIQVAPDDNWVQSFSPWTPGSTISLTVEDGSGVVYTDSQTADSNGNFNFELWEVFDLERGHIVTVSDGTTTKTHTVANLYVDGVDVAGDTVFGRADPGTTVEVWVHGDGNVIATADGSGNWVADFSAMADLTCNSDGGSQQVDADGDATGVWWNCPRFQAHPDFDWVQSISRWAPGAAISLTVEDGGGVIYSDSQTADSDGGFHFEFGGSFDLQRGHEVTVSDGFTTKVHTVIALFADAVDYAADEVSGRAPAGTTVNLWIHGEDLPAVSADADGLGDWTADYSGIADLTAFTQGGAEQSDDDGDSTAVDWYTPQFRVAIDGDRVESLTSWTSGATISLTVEDGSGVIHTDTQTSDSYGNFHFGDLGGLDVEAGHIVTVSDGTDTKVHTVIDVMATADNATDEVSGTASPHAWVSVDVYLFEEWSSRWVQADSSGDWIADFSVEAEHNPAFDITEQTFIDVSEFDDDADATVRSFGPPVMANRGVAVTPIDNDVWVASSGIDAVTRLDNDGNVIKIIPTGDEPTGVAVDAGGKVWVTNQYSDNTVRIDPGAGADGLGAIDLTVDLGEGAGPYNYSDMTGAVVVGSTSPQGFWTVIQDSGQPDFVWGRVIWNTEAEGIEPIGTEIVVEARTANSEAGLGGEPFVEVTNGEFFESLGRYIEVRVTLKASSGGESPVLSDIRIQPKLIEVDIDIKPGSYPNSINIKKGNGVVPVAVLGSADFDVTTIDVTTLIFGPDEATPVHDLTKGRTHARHLEDVNDDGYMDLVSHYRVREIGFSPSDTEAYLRGATVDGIPIEGVDSVRIIGKGGNA